MDLATTHLSADLDGLASLVALHLLEGPFELVLPGSIEPTSRAFWAEHGESFPPLRPLAEIRRRLETEELGRLHVVDTADAARLGEIRDFLPRAREVLAWDNHPRAEGDLPRVELPEAGACVSALVLRLAGAGKKPTAAEAGLFLLGIHMDTGHFTFAGTTALDHEAARLCLEWGAPVEWIGRYLPKGYTARELELLSRMAVSVEWVPAGESQVAILSLEVEEYEPNLSVLLEQLRAAERWPTAFLLAGSGRRVDVIGRSDGTLHIGEVVRALGGGGHREAGSATLRAMTLAEARAYLRQTLAEWAGERFTAGAAASSPFVSLPATATIRRAAERMRERRIDSLPLTRGRGKDLVYVGWVGRRDVDVALAHGLGDRPVAEISAGPPRWIAADAPLEEARRILASGTVRHLLVGRPPGEAVGILTRGALLRAMEGPALPGRHPRPGLARIRGLLREGLGPRWEWVRRMGEVAESMGLSIHLVGGSVRDLFLGRPVRDVDLVVEGDAPRLAEELRRRHGGRVRAHPAFGTASYFSDDSDRIDLASARAEHYASPAALPTVELHAGLRQDLFRRDFTINAMAISVTPASLGELHDPFGGWDDLQAGLLRVLHGLSFHDDPTRAFRAARFAARLDFRLSPETLGLVQAARRAGVFDRLGKERLGVEIERILEQPEVVQAFRLLREWKLLSAIHPRFAGTGRFLERLGRLRDARNRLTEVFGESLPSQADVLWIEVGRAIPREDRKEWGRMVPRGGERLRRFVHGWERVRRALQRLARARRGSQAGAALFGLDEAELVYAVGVNESPAAAEWLDWWCRQGRKLRTQVSGDLLIELGYAPGAAMGCALAAAREAAWDGEDPAAQLAAAERAYRRRARAERR